MKLRKERFGDPQAEAASEASSAQPAVRIQMNVGRIPQSRRSQGQPSGPAKPEADFEDLDQWDDDSGHEDELELPPIDDTTADPALEPDTPPELTVSLEPVEPPPPPPEVIAAPETDELSPPVRSSADPVSLRPHLRLSKVERVGIVALAVFLVALGIGAYVFSLSRLPSQSLYTDEVDFPVKGARVTVTDATSYWRAPVLDGATPDVVRRGTVVIPIVEVTTSSGNGAIRAVFRDQDRKTIGDSITRQARPGVVLKIASTAGFEDSGTHAAYRAGGGRPWTVEILEAPSADSPSTEFKRLFLMNLSTATR